MTNKIKSSLSIILCFVMILSMVAFANAAEFKGDGTRLNPYIISDASDVDALSKAVAEKNTFEGKFFRLENDIEITGTFTPIGSKDNVFSGNFDGNGHKISGINLACDYAGFFGYTKNAKISSLNISGEFLAENYAGAIVAFAENSVIDNCTSESFVYSDLYVGAIAGYNAFGEIKNSSATTNAAVGGYENYCGGIVGYSEGSITSCTNDAYIFGVKNVGGIAGASKGNIISSKNNGAVSAGASNAGGIAGYIKGEITLCENTASVTGEKATSSNIGGIAGFAVDSVISQSFNNGAVYTSSGEFAGGIAGYIQNGEVKDCLSTGNISAKAYAGGIFGWSLKGTVSTCVVNASVSSSDSTHAAIGAVSTGTVSNCYYNSAIAQNVCLSGTATDCAGLEGNKMAQQANFANLDFTNTWVMISANKFAHGKHPLLKNLKNHVLTNPETAPATCTGDGYETGICSICYMSVTNIFRKTGHKYEVTSEKAATCTANGYIDKLCFACGDALTQTIPAKGHTDENSDGKCDVCTNSIKADSEQNFFQKIIDFFNRIIAWFKGLFK